MPSLKRARASRQAIERYLEVEPVIDVAAKATALAAEVVA
jgi:hypothetical protein